MHHANHRRNYQRRTPRRLVISLLVATTACLTLASCADDAQSSGELSCPTIVLATHDSFALSDETLEAFTAETCITVDVITQGDAGQLVSQAILTAGNPSADVLFGVDTTFVQRAIDNDVFAPYVSTKLATVSPELRLSGSNEVTPISYSDVCVNYWTDALAGQAPTSFDDLVDPVNKSQFITQNPETSSPGFAFLLATIKHFGEDGWQDYWKQLMANDVAVASGWTESYYGDFTAGGGDRSMVTSYASSPPAEIVFAEEPIATPPTAVIDETCFRQVEFAGILRGTNQPEAAGKLVDFMLSPTYQNDIPLNQFVYPASRTAELPDVFIDFGALATNPIQMEPAEIEAGRDRWTEQWAEIVLR